MSDQSKIEWCDSTFNPWIGCTKVGPGCEHCYAEADFDLRKHRVKWGAGQPRRRTSPANWKKPLQWNGVPFYECKDCGVRGEAKANYIGYTRLCASCNSAAMQPARRRVFCASLADVFDNEVPVDWRADLFRLIADTPNLDWLLLTKRIGNAGRMIDEALAFLAEFDPERLWCRWGDEPWRNVWLGATICNQDEAERDIPKLLATTAAVRFLSIEPMLGAIDLERPMPGPDLDQGDGKKICQPWYIQSGIDWVIVGGESGPHARPMHPDWVRSIRDQCAAAGVPFLFKQWGEWIPYEHSAQPPFMHSQHGDEFDAHGLPDFESGDGAAQREWLCDWSSMLLARRVGKKAAGRLLDGVTHDGYPHHKD